MSTVEVRPAEAIRVTLVNRFTVRTGSGADVSLPGGRAAALLRLLVLHRGEVVDVHRIVDALWSDASPDQAPRVVASLVSRLRQALGRGRIRGGPTGYMLDRDGCSVDVDEAAALVREAEVQAAAERPALAGLAAVQALELLGSGRLLGDEIEGIPADAARRETDRLVRRARRVRWTAALRLGEHPAALSAAEAAVDADPLDEEAHRAVMRAHHSAGRLGAALDAYRRLRTVLGEDLGVGPSAESRALHHALLQADPLPEEARPAAASAVCAVAGGQLPLVGRARELRHLTSAWGDAAAGRSRTVLLTGAAGQGRSRLAAELERFARQTGGTVVTTHCHEATGSLFLQPLVDAVRGCLERLPPARVREAVAPWPGPEGALIPDVVALLGCEGARAATPRLECTRALEAVVSVILRIATRTPVLLVVEDADATDAATIGALHLIASRLRASPAGAHHLLLLVTARHGEDDAVQAALAGIADHLALGPLREADVDELARHLDVPGIASQAYETTRGHTLLASEMLQEASRRLPRTAHLQLSKAAYDLVLGCLRRAGAEVEQLLRVAATLDESFDVDTLADLAEATPEHAVRGVERALWMGLIQTAGSRLEFANPVIRRVLLDTTPEPVNVSRRRRAARLLGMLHPEVVGVKLMPANAPAAINA
ncbi:MAG: transcriptional regulator, putative ATPase, winged helix family [Chloroflexi bacterium]|jgi:DNA-binding SARP family transcriptional activator|nr:transcriptional regulator, putative ATPase, winged helix family [Chloroflexota bacterium]